MHFVDIDTGTEYEVAYTGGTDIQDKYGKIIAATGTQLGQIYDVTCNKSGKATEIHGSSDAWEKNSLTGVEFDESARRVKQASLMFTLPMRQCCQMPIRLILHRLLHRTK